jgi:maltooligosyltrehalose trehalohydrolase
MLGAVPVGDGLVEFEVWAPNARSVSVLGDELERGDDGFFSGRVEARPGDDYRFRLDGGEERPDPCSRCQPDGVRGPSRIVDTQGFDIRPGPKLDALVIYELHVGTFSREGTFDGAIQRFGELAAAGITAVEVMPIATFPGERGWGYDGLYTSAPHPAYGGPEGFARFVDAAHAAGLGVILDVVYNHVGPGDEALDAFGPYFTTRHETFWGKAIDYTHRGVREWALQNAGLWVRDYEVDGLRLDAVHAIFDDESRLHICAELKQRVGGAVVISEMEIGNLRPVEEWGHDAQWEDTLHHALHALLTGERDGYYEPYGSIEDVAHELRRTEPRFVACAQNHDQVGNRAVGDRLTPEQDRVALSAVLFSRSTPLVFMGEEYGETRPFQFFTDHTDPAIAEATREGRKQEFERFESFKDEVPDPQAEETFERSKLEPRPVAGWFRDAVALRSELPDELEVEVLDESRLVARRGPHTLTLDFAALTVERS